ncbi:MAG: DUF5009 domain-containing protein [Chitinophagaceae bacterium]
MVSFFGLNNEGAIISAPIYNTRVMGVLQRIALCYFFASLFIHYLSTKKVIIVSIILLIGYWFILLLFGNAAQPFSLLGNAGLYLDKFLMGNNHMYHGEKVPFDPEGWLSTLPAIVNVIIGYYAGRFIQKNGKGYDTLARLMLVGSMIIFVALCWNMIFPINKKLWTSSFVLLTTGVDLIILSSLIYILEIKNWVAYSWSKFFLIFGRNTLFIYLLSELLVVGLYMIHVAPKREFVCEDKHSFFSSYCAWSIGFFFICCLLYASLLEHRMVA